MTRKIAIGYVVYKPDNDQINRVLNTSSMGFKVYVYDNSPEKDDLRTSIKNNNNIRYLTCGKNVGLGLGISSVCAQAYYDDSAALLFFDQDTVYGKDTLDCIEDFYLKNLNLRSTYSSIVFNSKNIEKTGLLDKECFEDVSLAINSGSLFYLENVAILGWHNVKYFVDCVDYEFCLKSEIQNFKIGEYSCTPGFDHTSEQDDVSYRVFGREYMMRVYSPNRMFDTCSASLKLLYKSIIARKLEFASKIGYLFAVYIATQVFIRSIGWITKKNGSIPHTKVGG